MTQYVDASGNVLNKAALIAKASTVTQPTKYSFNEDIYLKDSFPGDKDAETRRKKAFYAGQIVGSDVIDALPTFVAGTVSGISPATGLPAAGGTVVTITGTNLHSVTSVTFGGTVGTALKKVNLTTIKVTAPAKAAGAHAVVVVTSAGNVAAGNATYV